MLPQFSGLILAGGRATRMGGLDKGLVPWRGKPLIEHVRDRLAGQVDDIVISCNRHPDHYRAYGHVVADTAPDYPGPLAGMAAGLTRCQHEWVVVVACDTPCLPVDLAEKLWHARRDTLLAVAHDGAHLQPLCLLLHRSLADSAAHSVANGEAAVHRWITARPHGVARFTDPRAFLNLNTLDELNAKD